MGWPKTTRLAETMGVRRSDAGRLDSKSSYHRDVCNRFMATCSAGSALGRTRGARPQGFLYLIRGYSSRMFGMDYIYGRVQ